MAITVVDVDVVAIATASADADAAVIPGTIVQNGGGFREKFGSCCLLLVLLSVLALLLLVLPPLAETDGRHMTREKRIRYQHLSANTLGESTRNLRALQKLKTGH